MGKVMNARARNSATVKIYNRKLIINMIRNNKLSRADITKKTGLTRAAVSLITDELIRQAIIVETGSMEAKKGRRPIELDVNADRYYVLGLHISRKECLIGVVNFKGEIIFKNRFNINDIKDISLVLNRIISEIKKIMEMARDVKGEFLGLGISAPGPVDNEIGKIINPPNFDILHNLELKKELEKALGIKVYIENNAVASTLGEKHGGYGNNYRNFLYILVGAGIGGGIVIDNKLYRGAKGLGSEIGHTCININGERCSCGNIGCVELYASIPAVIETAKKDGVRVESWNEIIDKAVQGDEQCNKYVDSEAKYLAVAIVNCINLFEPEAVILSGDINYNSDMLLNAIKSYVQSRLINRNIRKIPIIMSRLYGCNDDIISAATIVIDRYFEAA